MATTTKPIALDETLQRVAVALEGQAQGIGYRFVTPTTTASTTTTTDDTLSATLTDRAINTVQVASGVTTLNLTFPSVVAGYARDFFLRLDCAGTALATIALPSGETFDFGADALAGLTGKAGLHLALFTEIAANHWLISAKEAEA